MSSTTSNAVDVGALAGGIAFDVTERLAEALTTATVTCSDTDIPLSDLQVARLTQEMLRRFDGLEIGLVRQLLSALEIAGVKTWGISREHEAILGV